MKPRTVRAGIVGIWLVLFACLVRFEACPEYFTRSLSGYKGLLSTDILVRDTWMKILFEGAPIGYSHSTIETREEEPLAYYRILNRTYLKLNIMGVTQPVYVDTTAFVDASHQLQKFRFTMSSRAYKADISAERDTENTFDVTIRTGGRVQRSRVEIPPDVILYSPMTEALLRKLKPGQELMIRTLDPASMSALNMVVRALRREPVSAGGQTYEATVLEIEHSGAAFRSWMKDDGVVVRQETPFGWTMEMCSAKEAFEAVSGQEGSPELLSSLSVPFEGVLLSPRTSGRLVLRLSGVELDENRLITHRQSAEKDQEGNVLLSVTAAQMPGESDSGEPLPAPEDFLQSTPFVQSGDPRIVETARRITGGLDRPRDRAMAVFEWVYRNVRKEPTVSLPSAVDVLESMAGDCNEHTYLFAALARAAGIPAKIMVGLAWHEGAFYYHAWPAVYLGRWIEMDPTWGQPLVDATHIRLTEGELASQIELIGLLGRLKIELLEQESTGAPSHD